MEPGGAGRGGRSSDGDDEGAVAHFQDKLRTVQVLKLEIAGVKVTFEGYVLKSPFNFCTLFD